MKLQSFQYTPMGFRSPLYGEQKTEPVPDQLIMESWQQMLTDRGEATNAWAFRRKVINRALDRLRYFPDWLAAQDNNTKLSKQMRAFLEDTVTYINTGKRPMSLTVRIACLATERSMDNIPTFIPSRHTPSLRKMLTVKAEDYMWHWLKHDGGFNDMVCTLNVLFGDIDAEAYSTRNLSI
ncbi:hypothetical protein KODAMA_00380 [Serratia phage vB_SmaM-Kodama]|nr:hypothetical protein KODAMA_00380 [Serratia phage vB_SmaM-Kodama]